MAFSKENFLESYLIKQKELGRRQREYKKILSTKLYSRKDSIITSSYASTIERLTEERNDLRAKIWVASGESNTRTNRRCLSDIKCHVDCQEHLSADIKKLKVSIANVEKEISRVNKQVYDLNRKTIPDSQHMAHVARGRKKLAILQNQLEVGVSRECSFTTTNAELREEMILLLNHRAFFNDSYGKLVQRLNSDKKYLIELIGYALGTYDHCIDVYDKMDLLHKKVNKDRELRIVEMKSIMRNMAADGDENEFHVTKNQKREIVDILPKEFQRRDEYKRIHMTKIKVYRSVIDKIMEYTQSRSIGQVIEKFQQQESLYYSYFNYANEMSYHMTLLNNCVSRLYSDINNLKKESFLNYEHQLKTINDLEYQFETRQSQNQKLQKAREANDSRLENLMRGIGTIFELSNCDSSPLLRLLGEQSIINLVNIRGFLKILEKRIYDITACVYVLERDTATFNPYAHYVVQQIEKICDWPTDLADIVLTQQCPECAEGEAFNVDEAGDGGIVVLTKEEAKIKLYEKVNQPEMQYRLHSISQCRLPRSRKLAANRNA